MGGGKGRRRREYGKEKEEGSSLQNEYEKRNIARYNGNAAL